MMMSVDSPALSSVSHAYRAPYHAPLAFPHHATASSYHQHPHHQQQSCSPFLDSSAPAQESFGSIDAYMNPTLPPPPLQHSFALSPHHGIKRSAPEPDDEFERSNHISTHFKKLRLNNSANQHNPQLTQPTVLSRHTTAHPSNHERALNHESTITSSFPTPQSSVQPTIDVPTLPSNDFMTVDETPDKIYITDLDSEIAAIEAAERSSASQLFLPDFEKQIGAIPDHVLKSSTSHHQSSSTGPDEASSPQTSLSSSPNQALVLYQDPSSISVPEEEDAVRKAILEARRGIRERMRRQSQRERETAHLDLADLVRGRGSGEIPVVGGYVPPVVRDGVHHDHDVDDGMMGGRDQAFDLRDDDAMDIE